MRIAGYALLLFIVCLAAFAVKAQSADGRQILLLKIAANESEPVPITATDNPILLSYRRNAPQSAPMPPAIYVRVFRGRKSYLIHTMPKYFKKGCVNYSSALLTATPGGQMAFRGLDPAWLTAGSAEYFTLVFEAADPDSIGLSSLRLANDAVSIADYFNSGVEIQLQPPVGYVVPARVISAPSITASFKAATPLPVNLPPCHVVRDYAAVRSLETHPG